MVPYSHVLAAVDFSGASESVLRRAVEESRLHSAALTLLHVVEYYPEDVPPGLVPAENVDPIEVYRERARDQLKQLAAETGTGDARQVVLTNTGAAYHGITEYAKENNVDLIVMGYSGRWVTDALGSAALAVARLVVCDVLLVRGALREWEGRELRHSA